MSNIKEIARLAGVSSATVSRVINNNGYVSKETRAKIERIVSELDYVPNNSAVSLKKGATKMLGIVLPALSDTLTVFIRGFIEAAQKNSYNVSIFLTNASKEKEIAALEMLRKKQIDGMLVTYRANDWVCIKKYLKYGPIVTLQRVDNEDIPSVYMNHYDGYTLALEYLYAKGCRKIVNLYGNLKGLNTISRIKAYEDFLSRHKLKPFGKDFYETVSLADGERVARWYLETEDKPDGFAALSDTLAAGILTESKRLGLKIPEDFHLTGFDDIEISHVLDITTVNYPISLQAENAFIILQNILDPNKKSELNKLNFKLVERAT